MESKWSNDLYDLKVAAITIEGFYERLEKEIARLKLITNSFRGPEKTFVKDLVRLLEVQRLGYTPTIVGSL